MHVADPQRHSRIPTRRAAGSGLSLGVATLGLWQNFGAARPFAEQRELVLRAIDLGITHLDLANNYGPPVGAAEASVGRLLARDLAPYRDELVIATKAGYRAWPGPYGEHGSRKYLLASLDRSLARLGLDHVDVFYSHRYDPRTPLEETLGALKTALDSGRARYVGVSSYSAVRTAQAVEIARSMGLDLTLHQPSYSMVNRWVEHPDPATDGRSLLDVAADEGLGVVAFSPLAQGMLTDRYLHGIPADSRAARGGPLRQDYLSSDNLVHIRGLAEIAAARGQSLAQLALTWALRDDRVSSVLLGASSVRQLEENLAALAAPPLSDEELARIEPHAQDLGIDLGRTSSSV